MKMNCIYVKNMYTLLIVATCHKLKLTFCSARPWDELGFYLFYHNDNGGGSVQLDKFNEKITKKAPKTCPKA